MANGNRSPPLLGRLALLLLLLLALTLIGLVRGQPNPTLQDLLEAACSLGDLKLAQQMATRLSKLPSSLSPSSDKASSLHALSALALILHADAPSAVALHLQAKAVNATTIPPLAQLHLQGHTCGGLGDLFYVAAVIIKQMVDKEASGSAFLSPPDGSSPTPEYVTLLHEAYTTLITLASDSGLHASAELLMAKAQLNRPDDAALLFRAALLTPGVFESQQHLDSTRALLASRINSLYDRCVVTAVSSASIASAAPKAMPLKIAALNEFVLSPTFYFVYQGLNDRPLLERLHASYAAAHPAFSEVLIPLSSNKKTATPAPPSATVTVASAATRTANKIHVGFVSAHFRRHSVCKLFCGLATGLDRKLYNVYLFSALQENFEDAVTRAVSSQVTEFVRLGKTMAYNRREVSSRAVDVLIYLDVGMDPATAMWASGRLAPVQACLWGHPTTTGLPHIDYFISSDSYHHTALASSYTQEVRYFRGQLRSAIASKAKASVVDNEDDEYAYSSRDLLVESFNPDSEDDDAPTLAFTLASRPGCNPSDPAGSRTIGGASAFGADEATSLFSEQLVRLDSLGFYFRRPAASLPHDYLDTHDTKHESVGVEGSADAKADDESTSLVSSIESLSGAQAAAYTRALVDRPESYYRALMRGLVVLDAATAAAKGKGKGMGKDKGKGEDGNASSARQETSYSDATRELLALLEQKLLGAKVLLIPQHTPKFHPAMDKMLHAVLRSVPQLLVVVLNPEKKVAWRNALVNRWKRSVGGRLIQRAVWLPSLSPEQFTTLLAVGDVMLDPYPFGGGVTTLEALAMCTPVVTLSSRQSVPALAAGMIRGMFGPQGDAVSSTPSESPGRTGGAPRTDHLDYDSDSDLDRDTHRDSYFRSVAEKWLLPVSSKELAFNLLQMFHHNRPNMTDVVPHIRELLCGSPASRGRGVGEARVSRVFNDSRSVGEWNALLQRIALV